MFKKLLIDILFFFYINYLSAPLSTYIFLKIIFVAL